MSKTPKDLINEQVALNEANFELTGSAEVAYIVAYSSSMSGDDAVLAYEDGDEGMDIAEIDFTQPRTLAKQLVAAASFMRKYEKKATILIDVS